MTGTTVTTEAANVTGRDVFLQAGTSIGGLDGVILIALPLVGTLTDAEKLALAAAERGDVVFFGRDNHGALVEIDPGDPTKTAVLLRITPRQDFDVAAAGVLDATAAGQVGLGSELALALNRVVAGGEVRIKSQGSVTDGRTDPTTYRENVQGGTTVLEAEDGGIGTAGRAIVLALNSNATVTARAAADVVVTERAHDLNVAEVFSRSGAAVLSAAGAITDAYDDDAAAAGPDWNVRAVSVSLTAGAGVGTSSRFLETDLGTGALDVSAGTSVYLRETAGDLGVGAVTAAGNVTLAAAGSIRDAAADAAADVSARTITLTAGLLGTVGEAGNSLDIDSGVGGSGLVTTTSGRDAYLIETAGDLVLGTVATDAGVAFLAAPGGSILNGLASGFNVLTGKTYLFAAQNVGSASAALASKVGNLEGRATTGGVWVENTGGLEVGGVTDGESGVGAGGVVRITAHSPVTFSESVVTAGSVVVTATDGAGSGDTITVRAGVVVKSTGSTVELHSGDDLTIESGATVEAAGTITVVVDAGTADTTGANVTVNGTLRAGSIRFTGGSQADSFHFDLGATDTITGTVDVIGGGGDDAVQVTRLHTHAGAFHIDGGAGADRTTVTSRGPTSTSDYEISVFDSGADGATDRLDVLGTTSADDFLLSDGAAAARHGGTSERVRFDSHVEQVTLDAGSANDTFTIASGPTGAGITLAGGGGTDTLVSVGNFDVTLADAAVTRGSWGSVALAGIETANLTGGSGANRFTVTDWTGGGTLDGAGGTDTVAATNDRDVVLADTQLVRNGFTTLALQGVEVAALTGGGSGNRFTVSGWTGTGSINGAGGADTLVAAADADFTLGNAAYTRTGAGTLTLTSVESATLTGGAGDNRFTVGGWTGTGSLSGLGGTDTVAAATDADFTLGNTTLARTGAATLALSAIERAELAGGGGNNTFDVTGWTGTGTLAGNAGTDRVRSAGDTDFTLSDAALARASGGSWGLSGIELATLTGGAGDSAFTGTGWTGQAAIDGGTGTDVIAVAADADFTLAAAALAVSTGGAFTLAGVERATLTGGAGDNAFTVGGWAGRATLTGGVGTDTVAAAADANFTLTNAALVVGPANFALAGVERAALAGGAGDNTFTVSGWTGRAAVTGGAGADTVVGTANANFWLSNAALTRSDGQAVTLAGVERAVLTGGSGDNTFDVSGWTGRGTLAAGAGTDTIVGRADAWLSNAALTRSDGQSLALSGFEVANLTGGAGDNAFTVSGWTGRGAIAGGSGTDAVIDAGNFDFALSNTALTRGDGQQFALAGVERANLTGGAGNNTFTVTGWTGRAAIDGGAGTDTLVSNDPGRFYLAPGAVVTSPGGTFDLKSVDRLVLRGQSYLPPTQQLAVDPLDDPLGLGGIYVG